MLPLISKEKLEVVKMNSQKSSVGEPPEHELYDIEYSERTSYRRLKE
jgi:hypothetical protein